MATQAEEETQRYTKTPLRFKILFRRNLEQLETHQEKAMFLERLGHEPSRFAKFNKNGRWVSFK